MIKALVTNKDELITVAEVVKDYFDLSAWLKDDDYYYPNTVTMEFSEDHATRITDACRQERAKRTKENVLDKLIEKGIMATMELE
jgi:hypothetical protein